MNVTPPQLESVEITWGSTLDWSFGCQYAMDVGSGRTGMGDPIREPVSSWNGCTSLSEGMDA